MYKAIIFYFSGTGNTWWAADKIKKLLDARNVNADTISIDTLINGEKVDSKKADWLIKASDIVFFGWPIYGSDLPNPMKHFINNLTPIAKGKHVHTFCTQMKFSGDGAWFYHKKFADKGLIIDSCAHFDMPSNLSMFHDLLSPPKSNEQAQKIMARCETQINKYVSDLLLGKARAVGKLSYPLGIVQRFPYRLMFKRMQNLMGVNKVLCTKCGQCANLCPNSNISMNDFPEFAGKCALCLRCYSYCPATAVTVLGKTHNNKKHCTPYRLRDKRFILSLLKPTKK